jgi:SRSO17 transposase
VQRQYMGCASWIVNGVNAVYWSYATADGHAPVDARIYVPADQVADSNRRAALGIAEETTFRTEPQLAVDSLTDMVADAMMPGRCAGNGIYGRSGGLRGFCEDNGIGYVLRVGRAFQTDMAAGVRTRADAVASTMTSTVRSTKDGRRPGREGGWQTRAVTGSKGERRPRPHPGEWLAGSSAQPPTATSGNEPTWPGS